jgi:hypothetical protein
MLGNEDLGTLSGNEDLGTLSGNEDLGTLSGNEDETACYHRYNGPVH